MANPVVKGLRSYDHNNPEPTAQHPQTYLSNTPQLPNPMLTFSTFQIPKAYLATLGCSVDLVTLVSPVSPMLRSISPPYWPTYYALQHPSSTQCSIFPGWVTLNSKAKAGLDSGSGVILYCTISYYTILYYTILYYTILYYTILYYTILYYTILYYTILYYTILYYTILYYTILYYTILYYTILYYTILYYTILYYTILYYTILYYTILYYTILYYTILYYTILYYTILYYTILYYTILYCCTGLLILFFACATGVHEAPKATRANLRRLDALYSGGTELPKVFN